jgi:hypothetical protein
MNAELSRLVTVTIWFDEGSIASRDAHKLARVRFGHATSLGILCFEHGRASDGQMS